MVLSSWRVDWRNAFSLHFPFKFYSQKNLPSFFFTPKPSLSGATLRQREFKCFKLSFFLLMQLCLGKYRQFKNVKGRKNNTGQKFTFYTVYFVIKRIWFLTKQDTWKNLLLAYCVGNAFYVLQHLDNFQ